MSLLRTCSLLSLPLVLSQCGSRQDLILGEIATISAPDTGSAGTPAMPATAGAAGTAGSSGAAGSEATAGVAGAGGAEAGAGGMGGETALPEDCLEGSAPPLGSLLHRYSFEGSGAVATDSISGQDGQIVDAAQGGGLVSMNMPMPRPAGYVPKKQFVELPDGIVSKLTDLTVVAWATWSGESAYGRYVDFGGSDTNYFTLIPKTGFEDQAKPGLGGEIKVSGFNTVHLASTESMKNRYGQIAFSFQGGVRASLYLDATLLDTKETQIAPANINDTSNWIGQSHYVGNPPFEGSFEEVRIYNVALDVCQLRTLLERGPQRPLAQ